MKKKLAVCLALALALGALGGCTKKNNDTQENTQQGENNGEDTKNEEMNEVPKDEVDVTQYDSYFEMVSAYLNLSSLEKAYDGDYEFYANYNRFSSNSDGSVVTVNYQLIGGDREELEVDYTIANDSVTENVYRTGDVTDRYHSLIPSLIVLDGDIKMDNSWNQDFTYDGKTYMAETTIIRADSDSFTTETVVRGMAGYPDETYREERTYTKGEGLTYFAQSRLAEDAAKDASVKAYQLQD